MGSLGAGTPTPASGGELAAVATPLLADGVHCRDDLLGHWVDQKNDPQRFFSQRRGNPGLGKVPHAFATNLQRMQTLAGMKLDIPMRQDELDDLGPNAAVLCSTLSVQRQRVRRDTT